MNNTLLLVSIAMIVPGAIWSQATLTLTGNSYIVIDNNAKVVVDNPSTNAIFNSGSGGIMTEGEFDQVVWNIGANAGTYIVPFVSSFPIAQIPFSMNVGTAGTGAGRFFFSTWSGSTFDNNIYRPTDVVNMLDFLTGSVNNSNHVIDRFWIADAIGYAFKPSATLQFTYRDSEHLQTGNVITEASLGAQRFNSQTNHWGDYLPQGITNSALNTTSNVPVSPANFFRSWTLSEVTHPLSLEVAWFKSACSGSELTLNWQTTSESSLDHFEVEHMSKGQFTVIGFIQPAGGTGIQNYAFTPETDREGIFRLVEVNTDGERKVHSSLSANCSQGSDALISYDGGINTLYLVFEGATESVEPLHIFDAAGKLVFQKELEISKGTNNVMLPDISLSNGMYMVRLKNGKTVISEKIIAVR